MFKTIVRRKELLYSLIFISFIIIFTARDIIIDLKEGVPFEHVVHELSIIVFSFVLIFLQFRSNIKKANQISQINLELEKVHKEREDFKNKIADHSKALAEAVEEQLSQWGLTNGEKEIALLLIKGLSMKEIANLRNSQEATVRQQATAIYKKSQLENRQQLAAFFLEEIF